MSRKVYAYVGNWSFSFSTVPIGISIYEFNEKTADFKLIENVRQDIAAGQLALDKENNILYTVNERGEHSGRIGGGGEILAFKIDPETSKLELLSERDSLSPEPCFICLSKNKKYILAVHVCDTGHVTKIVQNADGVYSNQVFFDDSAMVLFPILEDGSIGAACDVSIVKGENRVGPKSLYYREEGTGHIQLIEVISRIHSVYLSPICDVMIACDKGMDRLISFKIDEENGRIIRLSEYKMERNACLPRYGAFHPTLPIFYSNNEDLDEVYCFSYDENGIMKKIAEIKLLDREVGPVEGKPVGAQDIQVSPDGKNLYVSLHGVHEIVVCSLDENGLPSPIQEIDSRGIFPRGLSFSPDRRFLISGNMVSCDITTFRIIDGGKLEYVNKFDAVSPSAIAMVVVEK